MPPARTAGIHHIDVVTALFVKVAELKTQIVNKNSNVMFAPSDVCDFCRGIHASDECQVGNSFAPSTTEQAHLVSNLSAST